MPINLTREERMQLVSGQACDLCGNNQWAIFRARLYVDEGKDGGSMKGLPADLVSCKHCGHTRIFQLHEEEARF